MEQKKVWMVCSGDLRLSANQVCWPAQEEMERLLRNALANEGCELVRGHSYDTIKKHGFIDSQRMGIDVFRNIPAEAPLLVAESVWQYSHHVLPGLSTHKGPILTVANWSGQWPGLVGMLNLNGSMVKADISFSTIWSENFADEFFISKLREWLQTGHIEHDQSHVFPYEGIVATGSEEERIGTAFGRQLQQQKAIMGVFDEGCMGMYNAIVPDHLLHPTGIFKERLSQSALFAEMLQVADNDAESVLNWLLDRGMQFDWGQNAETELTRAQTITQCKMYIAAMRIADEFGCDTIGIQYQQGLKDLTPASDLAEGLFNNTERPPVFSKDGRELYKAKALPHFNEVDECAGIDALVTYRLWRELGMSGETTLHDIRWGQQFAWNGQEDFVWVFLISGAAPPAHFVGGYSGASSQRQPAMYFRLGGGTLRGLSKPGFIVWSRVFVRNNQLFCDLGTGEVLALPEAETNRRWQSTTPQWPIMHAVLHGVNRDQLMATHCSNHIQVVYTTDRATALRSCKIKAAALEAMGITVRFCGIQA
jgi:hypothetical protein